MPTTLISTSHARARRWLAHRRQSFERRLHRTNDVLRMQIPFSIAAALDMNSQWVLLNKDGELWSADNTMFIASFAQLDKSNAASS